MRPKFSRPEGEVRRGTVAGRQDRRAGRDRPGAVRGDAALRHGRRHHPDRPRPAGQPGDVRQAEPRADVPGPALDRCRPEEPRRRRDGAAPGRAGRRAGRGLPARRHRTARARSRRLPRPEPEARLRPHDRLGPGRPDGAGRGPRHQLHRAGRRARALRARRRQAHAADQPRRRLRRRRHVHGVRRRVRHPRSAALGQGPSDRRRDGRRQRGAHDR